MALTSSENTFSADKSLGIATHVGRLKTRREEGIRQGLGQQMVGKTLRYFWNERYMWDRGEVCRWRLIFSATVFLGSGLTIACLYIDRKWSTVNKWLKCRVTKYSSSVVAFFINHGRSMSSESDVCSDVNDFLVRVVMISGIREVF